MRPSTDNRIARRTFIAGGAMAVAAAGSDLIPFATADPPTAGKLDSPLTAKSAVVDKLAALKPNQGILLGKADVVGEFNPTARRYELDKTGPRARDFTLKMCWAPDRKRALFCGANHGVPHRLNDVWEFDLPSLSWAMLYAPDLPRGYADLGKDTSDFEFKDGILVTRRGRAGTLDDVRLPAAAPGVDSKWEMRLYGLVRTGEREKAIEFLQETRRLSRTEAAKQIQKITFDLGLR